MRLTGTSAPKTPRILLFVALSGIAAVVAENPNTSAPPAQRPLDTSFNTRFAITLAAEVATPAGGEKKPDIHFVPTPQQLVDAMLEMARVNKDDIVYDLGSGDGRLVITAAKKDGARGIGIDIDPVRIGEANENAKAAGVTDKVQFLQQDLFKSDFSKATVITLYLLDELNVRLRPHIFEQAKPGTRVVSHAFSMDNWEPDAEKTLRIEDKEYNAYYWVVPANMSGRWKVSGGNGADFPENVTVEQSFQKITARASSNGDILGEGKINGTLFTLTVNQGSGSKSTQFRGKIEGNTIEAAAADDPDNRWRATREAGTEKPLDARN
jgi:hypothetical protein